MVANHRRIVQLLRPGVLSCLVIAFGASGCASVTSEQPVGDEPEPLVASEWEGLWEDSSRATADISVLDAERGLLVIRELVTGSLEPKPEAFEVSIRRSGEWLFASAKEEPEDLFYHWARLNKNEHEIVVWLPRPGAFKTLVEQGRLAGRVAEGDVHLGPLSSRELGLIRSGGGALFDWEAPNTFRRVHP